MCDWDAFHARMNALYQEHRRKGISWSISVYDQKEDSVYFSSFHRGPRTQPGDGEKALEEVLELVDRERLTIMLGTNFPKLEFMYRRHGFVTVYRQNPLPSYRHYSCFMVRRPL